MATITRIVISRPTTPKATENAPTTRILLARLPTSVFCSWVNSYCGEDDMATSLLVGDTKREHTRAHGTAVCPTGGGPGFPDASVVTTGRSQGNGQDHRQQRDCRCSW